MLVGVGVMVLVCAVVPLGVAVKAAVGESAGVLVKLTPAIWVGDPEKVSETVGEAVSVPVVVAVLVAVKVTVSVRVPVKVGVGEYVPVGVGENTITVGDIVNVGDCVFVSVINDTAMHAGIDTEVLET